MPALPAYCPNCNSIFPSGFEIAAGATDISFDHSEAYCPVCGNPHARIPDGVYAANSSAIQVLSAPQSSQAIIEAFQAIAVQAANGQISQAEAIQRAEKISPRYAALMEAFAKLGLPGLALLVAIISLYLQYAGAKSSSEDVQKIVAAITEQTLVLKNGHYAPRVEQESRPPSHQKAKGKSTSAKEPSKRRAEVNKHRRDTLKQRRTCFGKARRH